MTEVYGKVAAAIPLHLIKKQDLEDYVKSLALERGCPVEEVDRVKAHWDIPVPVTGMKGQYTKWNKLNENILKQLNLGYKQSKLFISDYELMDFPENGCAVNFN